MRWGEIIRRLVLIPPTLFGVCVIVFVLLRVVPGDPIAMMIPPGASAADVDRLRAFYGLDQSIPQQFPDDDKNGADVGPPGDSKPKHGSSASHRTESLGEPLWCW